ncbi:HpcH/HpaI aldolase family protein [Pseudobacillus wudalianchiensis]|uniref:Siderophore biosynthesis protein SbnG n=1 Tax=Pseudobacillus wudalianchiensis TaxID=1743143 RepID=A0A1B9AMB0_9BACI|nr:aldolase/citrate lyase family protein [Bacillus wudalianchiensis]OCA84980.1 siderophore biosynthesis protein SbnG [Bacillus wudalianchiensis]
MLKNKVKERIQQNESVFGIFCSIPNPLAVEMIGHAGYDFVIIDTEHASINPETVEHMIRAAEIVGLTPFVRVSENRDGAILRALDAGAKGVVVPHIHTAEDAKRAVQASRYYPYGKRSLNGGRSAAFGKESLTNYIEQANQDIMVILMIEDIEGIENLDEILSVPGVNLVLEGAADLSQSYGIPWQTRSERVIEGVEAIYQKTKQYSVPFCAIPRSVEDVQKWLTKQAAALVMGDDRGIFFRSLTDLLASKGEKEEVAHGKSNKGD